MNIAKSLIFIFVFLIYFQDNLYATEGAFVKNEELSKKAQRVKYFLGRFNIDQTKKDTIIAYFNQPGVGVPICIKEKTSLVEKYFQESLYFLNRLFENFEFKLDEKATAIASKFRSKVKLSPETNVLIVKKDLYLPTTQNYYDNVDLEKNYIEMNPIINKKFPETIPFRLAHEFAHLERGLNKNLLFIYAVLGATGYLLSNFFFKNKSNAHWIKPHLYGAGGAIGSMIIGGKLLNGYLSRREEKACDLRAIELIESDRGVKEFFCCVPVLFTLFSDDNYTIRELTFRQKEKPSEHTTWWEKIFAIHPSPAERVRYCQEYAKKCGYQS